MTPKPPSRLWREPRWGPRAVVSHRHGGCVARRARGALTNSPEDLGVELPDPGGERGHDLVVEGGNLVEQARELARAEHEHRERRGRCDGGGAGPVVEQRQLTHAGAGAERRYGLPGAAGGGLTLDDDERLSPDVALGHELLALVQRQLDRGPGDVPELFGRAPREQRDRGEMVEVILACHGGAA